MSILNTASQVRPESIPLKGTAQVELKVTAGPGMFAEPADIILVLDRTSPMMGELLEEEKKGALDLVDTIYTASGGTQTGSSSRFGSGARMGLVVYTAGIGYQDIGLTDNLLTMKAAITNLLKQNDPGINHKSAFEEAEKMLSGSTSPNQAIVFFSYTAADVGGDPDPAAQRLKDAGVKIFALGPETRRTDLTKWASDPKDYYLSINVGGERMNVVFDRVGRELSEGAVLDASMLSNVPQDFRFSRIISASHGTAVHDAGQVTWTIGALGSPKEETATLIYEIVHTADTTGKKPATAGNTLTAGGISTVVADPEIFITPDCPGCEGITVPEGCPEPTLFTVPGCQDAIHVELNPAGIASLGRIVQLDVTLKAVCPGKRVAASIQLMELKPDGTELPRGIKHILIPAREGEACQDITLGCVQFSLPEALDASGKTGSICNPRNFSARVIANYVDTDFTCCDMQTATI